MIINYSVKLITPALTGQSGVIGKDIDIVTKLDANGFPYFPAKHIKGIIRDKFEYYQLGEKEDEVKQIFGFEEYKEDKEKKCNKYETKVRFSHLNLSKVYGTSLLDISDKETLKSFLFGDRHGIRVDRETRSAIENSLFSYQYANPSLEFSSSIELKDMNKEQVKNLLAALYNIDTLGGQKSRGLGKVEVFVEGFEKKDLTKALEKVFKEINNKKVELKDSTLNNYEFTLEFLEDAVLTKSEKGNLIVSNTEINSSALRAGIIDALSNKFDFSDGKNIEKIIVEEVKPENSEILPASFYKTKYPVDGETRYKNKLLYSESAVKSKKDKEEESKLERADIKFIKNPENDLKKIDKIEDIKFNKESEISIAIDRETRSTEESKLFNFEIAKLKGERFVFTIKTTKELLEFMKGIEIHVGKMKSKGYGKAKIALAPASKKYTLLEERLNKFKDKEFYTLDVITDIILPFRSTNCVGEELKDFYGLNGQFLGDKSFVKVEKMAGYSLMNKMPKADEIVIKAGSVLTYSGEANVENLKQIEKNGIGLRKSEGYGKIEFCSERHFLLGEVNNG